MSAKPVTALLLLTTLAAPAGAVDVFTLSSADFKDGAMLAKKVGDMPERGRTARATMFRPNSPGQTRRKEPGASRSPS